MFVCGLHDTSYASTSNAGMYQYKLLKMVSSLYSINNSWCAVNTILMVITFSQSLTWQSPMHGWTRTPWSCSSLLWRLLYTFRHHTYSSSWFHPVVGEASLPNRWRSDLIIRWKAMYGDQAHIQLQFSRGACLRTPVDTHMPTLRTEPLPPVLILDETLTTKCLQEAWVCIVTTPQVIVLKQEKNNVLHYSNT